ncbi:MAG: ATP-binding cassette domain-containing protein [Verrucomicrobiales bacterium]|nr:ATP-binding cassette domain-containing protein [Verrucomicrobiales bacterium]
MTYLEVENLTLLQQRRRRHWFRYDISEKMLVEDISFEIEKGKSLSLVGEENSGKRAIVMAVLKLKEVASGTITLAEVETTALGDRHFRKLRRKVQAVFSDRAGQLSPEMTIDQMFLEVLRLWYPKESREEWQRRTEAAMVLCGLPEVIRPLYPAELDAVERQQAAIARALLIGPELLICDGVTQGLDAVQEAELLNLIRHLREEMGLTLFVATDDLAVAHQLGDAIGVLHRGRLLEIGPAESVVNRPQHDYTRRLVSCCL